MAVSGFRMILSRSLSLAIRGIDTARTSPPKFLENGGPEGEFHGSCPLAFQVIEERALMRRLLDQKIHEPFIVVHSAVPRVSALAGEVIGEVCLRELLRRP